MKHLFIHIYILISILNIPFVKAQQILNTTALQIKNISYIFDAKDQNQQTIWLAANTSALQCFELDATNKFVSPGIVMIPKQIKKMSWENLTFSDDTLYLTGYDNQRQLITIYWHKNTKTVFTKIHHTLDFYEHVLKTVQTKDSVYILTVFQNKNELNIYSLNKTFLKGYHYNIPFNQFIHRLNKQNELLNDPGELYYNIDYIDYTVEQNVKSTRAPKKLYYHEGTFAFVFDENNQTDVIEVNTSTRKVLVKNYETKSLVNYDNKHINSFFKYPHLYQLTTSTHRFDVIVWDVEKNAIIKHHSIHSKDTITFKNGNIIEEGVVSNQHIGENTSTFLRRLNEGYPAIALSQKDSLNIIEIGTFDQIPVASSSPNMSVGMGYGMGMGMGYGMGPSYMGVPQSVEYPIGQYDGFPGYYPYQNITLGIRSTYFHALYNPYTLETIEGIPPISFRERLSSFENKYFKEDLPEWVHIAHLGKELVVTYYDRKKNILTSYTYWL
jgi:hypothetical protein